MTKQTDMTCLWLGYYRLGTCARPFYGILDLAPRPHLSVWDDDFRGHSLDIWGPIKYPIGLFYDPWR